MGFFLAAQLRALLPLLCLRSPVVCVCVCLPPQRLVMYFGTSGRSTSTVGSSLLILLKVIVVCVPRGHAPAAVGTKLFVTDSKGTRYEPSSAGTLERMPCSPALHHAPSVLADYPTLIPTFFGDQPRTLAHANAVLPGALSGGGTRRRHGGGGSSARAAVPERGGARR